MRGSCNIPRPERGSATDSIVLAAKYARLLQYSAARTVRGRGTGGTTLRRMAKAPVLTPQGEDFPRWYQDVIAKAELAENGPARGTMVIRPYGFSLWERLQAAMDDRIKAAGVDNAYFPLFVPMSYFEKEAEHVEGFSPELAVVTIGGGKELEEPLAIRPTSETVMGTYFAKWIQSYRDLPLLVNQWANVVRWELRPRLFLRTTEFLWQEGHTCHATEAEARDFAVQILHEVYADCMEQVLAVPVFKGRKTAAERFAGAINTMACEAMMRDGKALQMGTSHELGQNFAKAFGIEYLSADGNQENVWQTSWGTSTRMVGGLIMTHGDDNGLRVPPVLAPIQVVVLVVRDEEGAGEAAARLVDELKAAGVRVRLDDKVDVSFGRRATNWELKGIPLRIEVGPRDLKEGEVTLVRRDNGEKRQVAVAAVSARGPRPARHHPGRPPGHRHQGPRRPHRRRHRHRGRGRGGRRRLRPHPLGRRSASRARPSSAATPSPSAASSGPTAASPSPTTKRASSPSWPAATDPTLAGPSRCRQSSRRAEPRHGRGRGVGPPCRRGLACPRISPNVAVRGPKGRASDAIPCGIRQGIASRGGSVGPTGRRLLATEGEICSSPTIGTPIPHPIRCHRFVRRDRVLGA